MAYDSWKTQTYWSLPVYAGDVSGVCSALYELGGMVVMHDPSGCNSTYNTHDEIRWSSRESLIFLSGLTQLDAITGNDKKLIDDIVMAAGEYDPAFIAIAASPVPWLIGTDFAAICAKITGLTHIPAFHVETNAMHDYTFGAGHAFLRLAQMLFNDVDAGSIRHKTEKMNTYNRIRVNVLGMTPLDFTALGEVRSLRRLLEDQGFEVVSVWAMGDGLDSLRRSLCADVNLVVSSCGIYAARWMEETFGIPYTVGIPAGAFAKTLLESLKTSARNRLSLVPYLDILNRDGEVPKRCMAGESVIMGSLAAAKVLSGQKGCSLVPLTETNAGLIPDSTCHPAGEEQIRNMLGCFNEVTADPMLESACTAGCRFEGMPHFALSGRMYLDRIRSHW